MAEIDGQTSQSAHTLVTALSQKNDAPAAIERRAIRRAELRRIVPLADTTIYEMEQRGEFPKRFNLTPRCVVWDLAEVEAWIAERRKASSNSIKHTPHPDVRLRKTRPVRP